MSIAFLIAGFPRSSLPSFWGGLLLLLFAGLGEIAAHQMPNSLVVMGLKPGGVAADAPTEVGMIRLDIVNNMIPPLEINQGGTSGGWWAGCAALAALAWILERTVLETTPFFAGIARLMTWAPWLLTALALGALFSYWQVRSRTSAA